MQLTYSHRITTKMALLFAAGGCIALALAIWPPDSLDGIAARAFLALMAPSTFYAASFFVRLRTGGPALSAEADGLRVNGGRGSRKYAWREIASIGRRAQVVSYTGSASASVPMIEIVLRAPGKGLWAWPGGRPIKISVGIIAEGEAAVERWIDHAQCRLGAGAPAYGLVPSTA